MRTLIGTAVITLFAASSALGGTLAPAKASAVVNLFALPNSATCCSSGLAFDHQLDSNGNSSAFSIPAKQALVVTEVDWQTFNGTSGTDTIVSVAIQNSSGCSFLGAQSVGLTDSVGNAGGTLVFPTGLVLRPGTQICFTLGSNGSLNFANVHGFLTKDQ